jgi:regulator of replication initiation timing
LPSDNPEARDPQTVWTGLEERIQRLMNIVNKLRTANAQLMKENQKLKLQTGQKPSLPSESSEDDLWKRRYEKASADIHLLKENLQQMQNLVETQDPSR